MEEVPGEVGFLAGGGGAKAGLEQGDTPMRFEVGEGHAEGWWWWLGGCAFVVVCGCVCVCVCVGAADEGPEFVAAAAAVEEVEVGEEGGFALPEEDWWGLGLL